MNRFLKKAVPAFLVLTLTMGLAGCSTTDESLETQEEVTAAESIDTASAETETESTEDAGDSENGELPPPPTEDVELTTVTVMDTYEYEVDYTVFDTFEDLPDEITAEREEVVSFERPEGDTHYYQVVYVETANVSWVQAAVLAESVGGYLASITSEEENTFIHSLVDDEKYYWAFPDDYTPDSHYGIMIGPFLGGTKTGDSTDSLEGWEWVSGEEWSYANWAVNLDDGDIDQDPRDNTQPNGEGRQIVMGFGELNDTVDTWGDYYAGVAQWENMAMPMGYNYGFVIEFGTMPAE